MLLDPRHKLLSNLRVKLLHLLLQEWLDRLFDLFLYHFGQAGLYHFRDRLLNLDLQVFLSLYLLL